jgi:unsaturated chondroitin disaccharide hydrolase
MDTVSGEPRYGNTHQGYADDSCWSRGQAWGIYGFLLTYHYTGESEFVEISRRLAHYFLNRLPRMMYAIGIWHCLVQISIAIVRLLAIAVCGLLGAA